MLFYGIGDVLQQNLKKKTKSTEENVMIKF